MVHCIQHGTIFCAYRKKMVQTPIFLEGIKAFQKEKTKGDFIFPE